MENSKKVYVKTSSYNLWWGIYGICSLTGWEDICIYNDPMAENELGSTCICTKDYLRHAVENLKDDPDEMEFIDKITEYINDDQIHYHYFYDDPADEDLYQLPYINLPLNANGLKPRSLEMWHPNKGIDISVIEECVKVYCSTFLNIEVSQVKLLETIPVEDAVVSYKEYLSNINSNVVFSDDLIVEMMNRLNKSKDEVINILNRSL